MWKVTIDLIYPNPLILSETNETKIYILIIRSKREAMDEESKQLMKELDKEMG